MQEGRKNASATQFPPPSFFFATIYPRTAGAAAVLSLPSFPPSSHAGTGVGVATAHARQLSSVQLSSACSALLCSAPLLHPDFYHDLTLRLKRNKCVAREAGWLAVVYAFAGRGELKGREESSVEELFSFQEEEKKKREESSSSPPPPSSSSIVIEFHRRRGSLAAAVSCVAAAAAGFSCCWYSPPPPPSPETEMKRRNKKKKIRLKGAGMRKQGLQETAAAGNILSPALSVLSHGEEKRREKRLSSF